MATDLLNHHIHHIHTLNKVATATEHPLHNRTMATALLNNRHHKQRHMATIIPHHLSREDMVVTAPHLHNQTAIQVSNFLRVPASMELTEHPQDLVLACRPPTKADKAADLLPLHKAHSHSAPVHPTTTAFSIRLVQERGKLC